jgi:hypothetical protein
MCPLKNMQASVRDNKLGFLYQDDRFFVPTEYAWKKVMTWVGMPSHFVRVFSEDIPNEKDPNRALSRGMIDLEWMRDGINRHLKVAGLDKTYMFRTYGDGTLRTMVSDQYGIIDNGWYLETLKELFEAMGQVEEPRLSHWKGDEDTMYGNLLIPDTVREEDDSDYGGMLSLSNCEIGKRSWSQRPSVFRAICCNGMIWDQTKGEICKRRHRGEIDLAELRKSLAVHLHNHIPLLSEGIDRFLTTKDNPIDNSLSLKNVFAALGQIGKFSFGSKGQVSKILGQYEDHEAGNRNLFGVINAVTRAGQLYSPDEWVRFDEFAGQLVTTRLWDKVLNNAKGITNKDLEKVYGTAV